MKDGTVVTWGQNDDGGDSRSLQAGLRGVDKIYSTSGAFAAVLKDGTVVIWGCKDGSVSWGVQAALRGVDMIYSTYCVFAVLKGWTVVTRDPVSKDETVMTVVTLGLKDFCGIPRSLQAA